MTGTTDLEEAFSEVKALVETDEKGRIVLGADYSGKNFRLSVNPRTGDILMTPVVIIPERDMWLYRNPVALASFRQVWQMPPQRGFQEG